MAEESAVSDFPNPISSAKKHTFLLLSGSSESALKKQAHIIDEALSAEEDF